VAYNTAELPGMMPRRPLPPAEAAKTDTPKEETAKADPTAEMDKKIVEQVKATRSNSSPT